MEMLDHLQEKLVEPETNFVQTAPQSKHRRNYGQQTEHIHSCNGTLGDGNCHCFAVLSTKKIRVKNQVTCSKRTTGKITGTEISTVGMVWQI